MKALILALLSALSVPTYAACVAQFEDLLPRIAADARALAENTKNDYFVEEMVIDSRGTLLEKRKLDGVPAQYTYEGRTFPSEEQQKRLGLSLYIRKAVLKDVRIVTERTTDGSEPSNYWFLRDNSCWKLASRAVIVKR